MTTDDILATLVRASVRQTYRYRPGQPVSAHVEAWLNLPPSLFAALFVLPEPVPS